LSAATRGYAFVEAVYRFNDPVATSLFFWASLKKSPMLCRCVRRPWRVLVEGAWTYRYPARVSETLRTRIEKLPKAARDIAWKAQARLCARYRRLTAAGKKRPVVIAAIARQMAAFLGAIGRQLEPLT
jgi:hypothetical protein